MARTETDTRTIAETRPFGQLSRSLQYLIFGIHPHGLGAAKGRVDGPLDGKVSLVSRR